MFFRLHPLRFSFVAREPIRFTPGRSGNILRGAFGDILRKIACAPDCVDARSCERSAACGYARMFEPSASIRAAGPSGLADWPRPFVFRASHLDGCTILPGNTFFFDLHWFDMQRAALDELLRAFAELARQGLGPGRGRAEVLEVLHQGRPLAAKAEPLIVPLDAPAERIERVRVRFLTPTELKGSAEAQQPADFGQLACRIRDRLSTLRDLYDTEPLEMDFRGFGERARRIRTARCELQPVEISRRSSRTGQVHRIGGFVGAAEYEGDLAEFVPFLRAAKWTGVGRQTTWGKGELSVEIF